MKVFDLRCAQGHAFEGWFASQQDFENQRDHGVLVCPVCGEPEVERVLSAPYVQRSRASDVHPVGSTATRATTGAAEQGPQLVMRALYERVVQQVMEHTEDVGTAFAEQARQMHRGEIPEAPIRGQSTPEEARALREEGIDVLRLAVPAASRHRLQ